MHDFNRTITTGAPAAAVYSALTTGFEHWWTKPQGTFNNVGDRVKFAFPPGVSYWTFEAVELRPNDYIELKCVEALHKHEGMPEEIETEWLGSRILWQIREEPAGTIVKLDHIGLNPDLLCFDICLAGWDHFYTGSLKAYLDTGTGNPHAVG